MKELKNRSHDFTTHASRDNNSRMNIKNKEHKPSIRQFITYSLLFICILVLGFYVKRKGENENKLLNKSSQVTVGTVTSMRYSTSGDWVRYKYVINGDQFMDVENTYEKNIFIGDSYEVEYMPSNPGVNRINFDKKLDITTNGI